MRWTQSLRNRLLLSITSVMIIGMLITAAISYTYSKDAIRDVVGNNMTHIVQTCRKQINSWVNDVETDLKNLAYNALVASVLENQADSGTVNALLQKVKADYPFYENLVILNKQGLVVAGSNPKVVGKLKLADRSYFREAISGRVSLSKPVASRDTGDPIFVLAVPVKTGQEV